MGTVSRIWSVVVLMAVLLRVAPLAAAALSVAPTRLELGPGQGSDAVTLRNDGDRSVLVQVDTFRWTGPLTQDALEPTRELLAVPAIFRVPPGGRQVIRVALRRPFAGTTEVAYRLLIAEVPEETEARPGGVRFTLRLSLPVFVTPPGAQPRPEWSLHRQGRKYLLVLRNTGNAHIRIRKLRLRSPDGGVVIEPDEPVAYVLAGGRHVWELPAASLRRGGPYILEAESQGGPISVPLSVEGS
ncbi:MAG TPA: molecular chaperone [Rhodospirillales bacterium]|nr:molecular chaperone [Rhodospirillales bacterium]